MNEMISLLMNHRSIRKFKNEDITSEQLHTIIRCGQMASTSSHMQAYSVIRITDKELRAQLAALAGNQAYVAEAPEFLVWCADLQRLGVAIGMVEEERKWNDSAENFLVSAVDTALAAQNAAVAAESMGLGIVYIGGIRNQLGEVTKLLKLPKHVFPVFGMCIGIPDQEPSAHPRLPLEAIIHENSYSSDQYDSLLKRYNDTISQYMNERTGGKRTSGWSEMMAAKSKQPERLHEETLRGQGFGFK
ncbi:oxygen-insensitive NADPH nitroreductase [Paenibacillus sp. GCM10023252]|uniref:oxygen-insensitive NADPH nitroreductase n=1 Tax=Paenibacillus sp. GCM10023252 TaxID=3252649 RepID=UPI0036213C29